MNTRRWLDDGWGETLALVLLALAVFAPSLPGRELLPPDEPRFAMASREMLETGDPVLPRAFGEPYLDKPPLLLWLGALGLLAFGPSAAAATRIASLLATLATVALGHRSGRLLAGARVARLGSLIFVSALLVLQRGAWNATDPLLVAGVSALLHGLLLAESRPRAGGWLAATGLAVGLLAKGPVVLVFLALAWGAGRLPGCRPLALAPLLCPGPLLLLAALVLPWPLLLLGRVGELATETLFTQSVTRFTHSWDNLEPWWYHAKALFLGFFPWSLVLLPALSPSVLGRLWARPALRWLMLVLAAALVFFSIPAGKRGVYLLPLYPALALVAGAAFEQLTERRACRVAAGISTALGALLLAAGAALALAPELEHWPRLVREVPELLRAGCFVLLALGISLAGAGIAAFVRPRLLVLGPVLFALATGLAWPPLLTPALNAAQGAERFAAEVADQLPPPGKLAFARGKRELVAWYTGRRGPHIEQAEAIRAYLAGEPGRAVIGRIEDLGALAESDDSLVLEPCGRLGRAPMALLRASGEDDRENVARR